MKTAIELAREAGNDDLFDAMQVAFLDRLVELARAEEREKYMWEIHSCGPTCNKPACVSTREAVAVEREACAEEAEDIAFIASLQKAALDEGGSYLYDHRILDAVCDALNECATVIRARGQS